MKKEKKSQEKKTQEDKINKKPSEEKTLRNFLIVIGLILLILVGYYFYAQCQIKMSYEDIDFRATSYGQDLLLYETLTLLPANDGTNIDFGFRLRTNPRKLKKIKFNELDNYSLMKIVGINMQNESFNCDGNGVIAIANIQRLFQKMGTQFVIDKNSTCDENGRYNLFLFKYSDKTQIERIGNNCYEVSVKGDENSCEILEATEKIMIETFVKYKEFQNE